MGRHKSMLHGLSLLARHSRSTKRNCEEKMYEIPALKSMAITKINYLPFSRFPRGDQSVRRILEEKTESLKKWRRGKKLPQKKLAKKNRSLLSVSPRGILEKKTASLKKCKQGERATQKTKKTDSFVLVWLRLAGQGRRCDPLPFGKEHWVSESIMVAVGGF